MARPKRMGAYNALDELLPGPSARPRLEPVPDPPPRRRLRRPRGGNALDALLPGPEGPDAGVGLDWGGSRARLGPVGDPGRPRAAGGPRQHLGAWNPLDELAGRQPPAPTARSGSRPARSRLTVRLPDELIEAARDAVAHLAGTARETTLTALAERGIRAELGRLTAVHNGGRPFPPRRARRSR
jgi:hypothetical protein